MNPPPSSHPFDDFLVEIELAIDGLPPAERAAAIRNRARENPEFRGEILAHFELGELIRPPERPDDRAGGQLQPGEWLGAFQVIRFITRGGMGEVYEAREASLDRPVALKVIKKGTVNPTARSRFRREQQVLAKLHHTNIVPIYHAGERDGTLYCAMQFIRGASLHGVISELSRTGFTSTVGKASSSIRQVVESILKSTSADGAAPTPVLPLETAVFDPNADAPLPRRVPEPAYFESVAALLIPAAEALQHVHDQRVCHRDIKPSNLMIDTAGHCWVIDFGLAGIEAVSDGEVPDGYGADEEQLTHGLTNGILGTPAYMAPEQFDERPAPASDIWSLGVTLYELLTLRRPFAGSTREALRADVQANAPAPPRSLVPNVPRDLQAICLKALEKKPEDRYGSAQEIADDLRRWLHWQPTAARPDWLTLRPLRLWAWRKKAWAATAAVVLFALVAGMLVAAERAEERQKQLVELQKQQEREHAVLKSQEMRLDERPAGWSRESLRHLENANAIRSGSDLRDQAAATLNGLDARPVYEHEFPFPPKPGQGGVGRVVFSPDGVRVLAAGWRNGNDLSPAMLWDGNNANKPTPSARPGAGPVAFPDADSPLQLVLPTDAGQPITLWNVDRNVKVLDIPLPVAWPGGEILEAALSPDARFAAVSFVPVKAIVNLPAQFTALYAIDRKALAAKKVADWPGVFRAMAFTPDGLLLATGSPSGEVVVHSTADGKPVLKFTEGELPITGIGFGRNFLRPSGVRPGAVGPADNWLLAVGSKGGSLSVWDLRTPSRMNRFYGSEHVVYGVAFSPDGSTLGSCGRGCPLLWNVSTGRQLLRVCNVTGGYYSWTEGIAFSSEGSKVAFGSYAFAEIGAGSLDVFRLNEDRGIQTFRGLTSVVEKVWLSPSGRWVAALAQDWQLGVWDRSSGHVKFIWTVPPGILADNAAVAFDENDTQMLFASGDRISKWEIASGKRTGSWQLPSRGLNDSLATRPGKKPLYIRRERVDGIQAVRARELEPEGKLTDFYTLAGIDPAQVEDFNLSSDGRILLVNLNPPPLDTDRQFRFFDGLTGKPSQLEIPALQAKHSVGRLSPTGTAVSVLHPSDRPRYHVVQLPDLMRLGAALGDLKIDDAGKLGVSLDGKRVHGVALYRVGDERPVVTFDTGRIPNTNSIGISADGRFCSWGQKDGSVYVADVNKCLEQIATFVPNSGK